MPLPSLYLSGPITGLSFDGATDWRHWVSAHLAGQVKCWSPMRGKDYLKGITDLSANGYEDTILSGSKQITCRDRFDTLRCDMTLMNLLGAPRVSIGTMIELGWADSARRPIVLVMEKTGNVHDHMMVKEMCGFHVHTLEDALHVVRATLSP